MGLLGVSRADGVSGMGEPSGKRQIETKVE